MYKIEYHKKALKDIEKLKQNKLDNKTKTLIQIIHFKIRLHMKNYCGDLNELYSRRINIKHRLVYQVLEDKKIVRILSMWSHYENI